jgi:hypothetical protein
MIFSREYVAYLAKQTVKQLMESHIIKTDKEVRVILDAYRDEMSRSGASYPEMFKKVKGELARKYKAVL